MNTARCLVHNQEYDPRAGGYCPYCGVPTVGYVGGQPYMTIAPMVLYGRCDVCGGERKPGHSCMICAVPGQ